MSDTTRLTAALADRYRIERELGQGGMATVFLAEDLKHHRQVAIKVLRPELAAVLGAERFVQEITTTAALQHPHILPLFDSGTADGFLYYVMPYIEGETLRTKLDREQQLGIDEAVKITVEIADALDYAHRHGVVHRDIKPENILLHDGRPMVADFGIALAVSAAAGGRMTETGMSLGTPHYMSPEQATADRTITGRSDVYSLASVLYEMLAGEPPHMGNSAQQIIMKIIADVPRPVSDLRKAVPPFIAASVARALEKLPADRFATAREFAEALQGRGPMSETMAATGMRPAFTTRSLVRHPLVLGLVVALALALAFAGVQWRAAHDVAPPAVVRFHLDMPQSLLVGNAAPGTYFAVSPDGKTIAYALAEGGVSRVHVRALAEGTAHELAATEGVRQMCFSPDGKWIAYLVGNVIWKIPTVGGTPIQVGPTNVTPTGLTWSPAGVILIGTAGGLQAVPAAGGPGRMIAEVDSARGEIYFNQPHALSDGRTVLFSIQGAGSLSRATLGAVSLATGAVTRFEVSALDPLAYVDGLLVYVTPAGTLMAVPLDLRGGRTTGSPVTLGPTVTTTIAGASEAVMSESGTLVYQPANAEASLGWVDLRGQFQPIAADVQAYAFPRLSPDGRRIAMAVGTGGRSDVWIYDLASNAPMRLTSGGTVNDRPEWSPDGRRVLYRTDRDPQVSLWWQAADLSGPPEPLLSSAQHAYYEGVISPDGRYLAYQVDDGGAGQADIMYRAMAGDTAAHPVSATGFVEAQPRISPDGRWIAFVTDASGSDRVVVQPFPGPGGRVQVSVAGGSEPVWSRDGRRLFYRDGQHLIAASVTTAPTFAVTARTELFPDTYVFTGAPHANYDVSPDGTRFLMLKGTEEMKLFVTYGYLGELQARMRTAGEQ